MTTRTSGRVVMGWLAIPIGALPGWTHGDVRTHSRYRAHVRLAFLVHRSRLEELAASGR
ncbi:MAG TPA: hypothetical protein VIC55_05645 [Gemmatimonadaceae bacterium]